MHGWHDPDRSDGSALEYLDDGVRVRLIVADGARARAPRTMLSRLGVRPDPVGEDFVRFVDAVRPQVVHAHDIAGQSLDLIRSGSRTRDTCGVEERRRVCDGLAVSCRKACRGASAATVSAGCRVGRSR